MAKPHKCPGKGEAILEVELAATPASAATESSFSNLIGRELAGSYRLAGYILGDATEAQDAVQEALERAWTGWPRLRNRDAAKAWFGRILVNVCRTRLAARRRTSIREINKALDLVDSGDPFRESLLRDTVGRALADLTGDQRIVIVLRFWGPALDPGDRREARDPGRHGQVPPALRTRNAQASPGARRGGSAMNTNDIERQLETLAANSANPDMPLAILDRMAQLEAGTSTAGQSEANVVRLPRLRLGATSRSRGLTLLGAAAILALVGGVMSVSGGHPVQPTPAPTQSWSPPPSMRVSAVQPTTALKAPASLGPWRRLYTFGSEWTLGHVWGGGPFQPVWLSWQNNEIIGLATRYRAPEVQQLCVLQSKEGTDWTCAELPTPTGEACGPGPCPEVTGLAVHNGRWVVVGYSSFKSPSLGTESSDRLTLLTWTSLTMGPTGRCSLTLRHRRASSPGPSSWAIRHHRRSWRPATAF
jgi:RNA polymerase sigma-70 factor (ECF subfamily)